MKVIVATIFTLITALGAADVSAQEASPAPGHEESAPKGFSEEGLSLMEKGMKLFMRGLAQEMEPAMRDLEGMTQEWGPAIGKLLGMVDDFTNYYPPEMLPNGDIIIRRKQPDEKIAPKHGEIDI